MLSFYLVAFVLLFILIIFIQPLIVFYYSWKSTNFSENYLSQNLPYSTDMSGFAGLPEINKADQLIGYTLNESTCENGLYVGSIDMPNIDCSSICNATSSKQFTYKFISSNKIIINNQYLRSGAWCLPSSLAYCNLNISIAVKSLGHYECITKFPNLLGGPYGNDIIGCAPIYEFKDNLKKLIYTENVPTNLVIDDLDEKLINSPNEYRYTCNIEDKFSTFTSRPDLGNRFQLYYDSCSFFDPSGKMVNNKCECSSVMNKSIVKPFKTKDNEIGDENFESICSTCTSGYGIIDEKFSQYGSKYGLSVGIDCVDPINIEYYKTIAMKNNNVLPCGTKTLMNIRESDNQKKYGCHRALLNVTNSYTPEMLQRING